MLRICSGYFYGVHADTHPESADRTFAFVTKDLSNRYLRGRYLSMNLWRSIDDDQPILDNHMAFLDQTSVTKGFGSEVGGRQKVPVYVMGSSKKVFQKRELTDSP